MKTHRPDITFISAGAGSGKTYRLTEILFNELASGAARPSGVIATTFTKRAAAELRERVRGHLLSKGRFGLANAAGQAQIGTVNSVCGALLERFAFEAGLATKQQVLDEAPAKRLIERAVDAIFDATAMAKFLPIVSRLGLTKTWRDELGKLIGHVRSNDIDPVRIEGFGKRNADDLLTHFGRPRRQPLTPALRTAIDEVLPDIELAAVGGKQNTNKYLAFLRQFKRDLDRDEAKWSDWLKLSKERPEAALGPTIEPIVDVARAVAEDPGLHADIRAYLDTMFRLCMGALESYTETKRELGVLDFTDQEHLLLKLLDHPSVVEVLTDELDLLMVDEFQDTSPIQLALFLKLARFAKRTYWVGDIKQAIYGFRGSDTELMKSVLTALPTLNGKKQVLAESWRSRPELVALTNAVFTPAFANSLPATEVALAPRRNEKLPGAAFANWVLCGANEGEQADALATGVKQLVAAACQVFDTEQRSLRNIRYGDIAVLARSGDHVATTVAHLSAYGIPVATSEPGLLSTPEATLATACLRRLLDRGDTIATAEILSLADSCEPKVWVADRLRYLQGGGKPDLWREEATDGDSAHPLLQKLAALRSSLPLLAPQEALLTVITECDLAAVVVGWSKDVDTGRTRLANLEALLQLASQYEEQCESGGHAASISGLMLWFDEHQTAKLDYRAEPALDAVKVITHHGAKGLEWPVVVLTDLNAAVKDGLWSITAKSLTPLDVANPLKDRFIRYWPWPFGQQSMGGIADTIAATPEAQALRESAREEAKRLLYVSMTRARDLMVFARSGKDKADGWLSVVKAPWLASTSEDEDIILPNGKKLKIMHQDLQGDENKKSSHANTKTSIRWFPPAPPAAPRLPLVFNPSNSAMAISHASESISIGRRIAIHRETDMEQLGNAIHACIATSMCDRPAAFTDADVSRTLSGFGVDESVSSADVLRQIRALHEWIAARWGDVNVAAEYPVQAVLANGQWLNGRIDLLLDTPTGWVLIDHKASPFGPELWDRLAAKHGG